jgi:phosphatidylinositol alpha-1,6-mannosyltransferase
MRTDAGGDRDEVRSGRLRLAFVCHCLRPEDGRAGRIGGAERAAAELLAALHARADVDVRLIAASAASDRLKFLNFATGALGELGRLARAGEIDAVLFTAFPTAWMSLFLAPVLRRHGVATGAICHGHDITFTLPPYQWLLPRVFEALDAILPVSRATADECLRRGVDPARLQVVFNGADLGRFPAPPPFEARRGILRCAFPAEAETLGAEDLVICTVGRQVARKGHAWFVREVMPRLQEGVSLWLAGDGPEAAAIASAARAAGVEHRVRRLGAIGEPQLNALYRGADLMVMPNVPVPGDIEGFGLVLLEANLNGLPVVTADIEGPAEVVSDGVNGRLAKALDAGAFVQTIDQLRSDPAERRRLGLHGEAFARETFSWAPVAQQHVEALERARTRVASTRRAQPAFGGWTVASKGHGA